MTALNVLHRALQRGLTFQIIGPGAVGIAGARRVIEDMEAELDEHRPGLVALVEEFAVDSFPVCAAKEILRREQSCKIRAKPGNVV